MRQHPPLISTCPALNFYHVGNSTKRLFNNAFAFQNMKYKNRHIRDYSSLIALAYAMSIAEYPIIASFIALVSVENTPIAIGYRAVYLIITIIIIFVTLSCRLHFVRGSVWIPIIVFWLLYTACMALDTYFSPIELLQEPLWYWVLSIGSWRKNFLSVVNASLKTKR